MFWKLAHLTLLDRLRERYTVCRPFDRVRQKGHRKMAEIVDSRILRMIPLLALVCLVSIPAEAKYSGGSGTPEDPYQIATAEDLIALSEETNDYDKHFVLTADIDLDPNLPGRKVFEKAVIAPDTDDTEYWFRGTRFKGVFDDNGIVDAIGMRIMVEHYWGTDNRLCDIGPMPWGDGIVDIQDLIVLAEHLFEEFPPVRR